MGRTAQEICWRNATYKNSERSINAQGELDLIGDSTTQLLELGIELLPTVFQLGLSDFNCYHFDSVKG